jgi:hypothetical protein
MLEHLGPSYLEENIARAAPWRLLDVATRELALARELGRKRAVSRVCARQRVWFARTGGGRRQAAVATLASSRVCALSLVPPVLQKQLEEELKRSDGCGCGLCGHYCQQRLLDAARRKQQRHTGASTRHLLKHLQAPHLHLLVAHMLAHRCYEHY